MNQKVILLTRSQRWRSILHQHIIPEMRVTALDFEDLLAEASHWPGSVAVVEVDASNLVAATDFAIQRFERPIDCGLFVVADGANAVSGAGLTAAGFLASITKPAAIGRLMRQIEIHHANHRPAERSIEAKFQRRLPWKPLDRYANRPFVATRFSPPETT
jgi:hypothetical protein